MKPRLFILKMPFEDGPGKVWICSHCAIIESALTINPHWTEMIDVQRIDFPKPRKELIAILGEDDQWLPVLIAEDSKINDPIEIVNYLARHFGGAAIHP